MPRPRIIGLFAVVALSAMSASALAAPIGTIDEFASYSPGITKVADRQPHGSQAHNGRQVRRFYGAAGLGDPPADNWQPRDSNNLQFGSAQWWQQHQSGHGR